MATVELDSEQGLDEGTLLLCMERAKFGLRICDHLEQLADDLPYRDAALWFSVRGQCRLVLRPYFELVNSLVLPSLLGYAAYDAGQVELLSRLATDCRDRCDALVDLDHLLSDAVLADSFVEEPEALGFALRGYFEALRRDLHWQIDVLWPLVTRRLGVNEAAQIAKALVTERKVSLS